MLRINFPFVSLNQIRIAGKQGASMNLKTASALVTCSGATSSATNLISAGWMVGGVTIRNVTLITASAGTGYTIGDGTTANKWGAAIALTKDITTIGTAFVAAALAAPWTIYASAVSVVLTMTGGSFTGGTVRVTVHYIDFTPSAY